MSMQTLVGRDVPTPYLPSRPCTVVLSMDAQPEDISASSPMMIAVLPVVLRIEFSTSRCRPT